MENFRSERLNCGCCGIRFSTWEGYVDQDQDKGYGICCLCQDEITKKDEAEFDRGIELLSKAMTAEYRAKFETMDRELKKRFVAKAIADGVLSFAVRKK